MVSFHRHSDSGAYRSTSQKTNGGGAYELYRLKSPQNDENTSPNVKPKTKAVAERRIQRPAYLPQRRQGKVKLTKSPKGRELRPLQTFTNIAQPQQQQETRPSPFNLRGASIALDHNLGDLSPRDEKDLTTRQSELADKNAITAGALLIASQGRDKRSITENPAKSMSNLMTSLIKTIEGYDHSDEGAMRAMNYIAGQLKKSWSPKQGGVGRFTSPETSIGAASSSTTNTLPGWNSDWDKLGDKFKKGNHPTAEDKQQLIAMCEFFEKHSEDHFSVTNHPLLQRIREIQFVGTIGQIMEDFLQFNTPSSQALLDKFSENGVMSSDTYLNVDEIRRRCRTNDLLSEVSNKDIIKAIIEQLKSPQHAKAIKAIIKQEISQGSLDRRSYEELIDQVFDRYVQKVSEIQPKTWISGGRGRGKGIHGRSMLNMLNGHEGVTRYPLAMPDGADDEQAMKAILKMFSGEKELEEAIQAIEDGALESGFIPKTITRLNSGLSSVIKRLVYDQPGRLIREAATDIAKEIKGINRDDMAFRRQCRANGRMDLITKAPERVRVLEEFTDRLSSPRLTRSNNASGISKILGQFKLPYNKNHKKKISLKDFAENKCAVGLIAKHHLRTICGPSGTTVDTLIGLLTQIGKDEVNKIVEPLFKHVEYLRMENPSGESTITQAKEFQTFFAALSTQMQGGQYHTVAEVLVGTYIVGMAMQNLDDEEYFNLEKTLENIDLLLEDFAQSPGQFFPVEADDIIAANEVHQEFKAIYYEFSDSSSSDSDDDSFAGL